MASSRLRNKSYSKSTVHKFNAILTHLDNMQIVDIESRRKCKKKSVQQKHITRSLSLPYQRICCNFYTELPIQLSYIVIPGLAHILCCFCGASDFVILPSSALNNSKRKLTPTYETAPLFLCGPIKLATHS